MPLAEGGDQFAQWNLGNCYLKGQGVEQDYNKAFKWYLLSAKQGNKKAQHDLGVMYDLGEGIPINHKEAFKWFLLSAEQGFVPGQKDLGNMYRFARGVNQDNILAHMWWNLASSAGVKAPAVEIALNNKEILEKEMTPEQIEDAQRLARNWKPKK